MGECEQCKRIAHDEWQANDETHCYAYNSETCRGVAAAYQRGLRAGVPTWQPMETAPLGPRAAWVIIADADGFVCEGYVASGGRTFDGRGNPIDNAAYWQPLPAPPVDAAMAEKLGGGG
jgi:hypothetical protein